MALDILLGFFTILHLGVLRVDVRQRQCEDLKEFFGGRVRLEKFLVGNNLNITDDKTGLERICHGSLNTADRHAVLTRHLGFQRIDFRNVDPHHILAGLEHTNRPVGGPGIKENRLTGLVAGHGVSHARRVAGFDRVDVIVKVIDLEVVGDDLLTTPAGRAGGQVGLAVVVGVKSLHDLGALEIVKGFDVVLLDVLLGHQVALQSTGLGDVADDLDAVFPAFGHLADVVGEPAVGPVIDVAKKDRLVKERVLQLLGFFDIIAQFRETGTHQCFLEIAGIPGGPGRLNLDPFTGHVMGGKGRYCERQNYENQ